MKVDSPKIENLTSNGFVKTSGSDGTLSVDTTSYQPLLTPAALTKTDDTNVTITLGGTPATSLLQAVSLTLGWTGTLADGRIASAATWNAKQVAYTNLTTIGSLANASGVLVNNGAGVFSYTTTPTLTGTNFSGTASSLNIGGNAATATNANNASTWNGQIYGGTYTTGTVSGFLIYNSTALDWRLATSVPTAISNTITTVGTLTAGSIPYSLITGTPSLTGYVPYTGATGNVNLGTNAFSSARMASAGTSITGVATQTNISAFNSTGGMIINGSIANSSQDGITYQSGSGGGAAIVFKRGGAYDTYVDFYVNNSTGAAGSIDTKWLAVDKSGAATFSSSVQAASLTLTSALGVAYGGTGLTASGSSGNLLISNGTGWVSSAVPTWNQSTTGTAASATLWNGYALNFSLTTAPYYFLAYDAAASAVRPTAISQVQTSLGLGSNAYTSTAYVPYTGATGAVTLGTNQFTAAAGNFNETATFPTAIVAKNRNATQQWGIAIDAVSVDDKILAFIDQTNGVIPLKLAASTGNATFLGTINSGAITVNSSSGIINSTNQGTAASYLSLANTGGTTYIGRENSTGSGFGATAYSTVLNSGGAYPLEFWVNGAKQMYLPSTGGLVVGTTLSSGAITSSGVTTINAASTAVNASLVLNTTGTAGTTGGLVSFQRSGVQKFYAGLGVFDGLDTYQIGNGSAALTIASTGAATFSNYIYSTAGYVRSDNNTNNFLAYGFGSAYYGMMSATSSTTWALGYAASAGTLGTSVLTWNTSGAATFSSSVTANSYKSIKNGNATVSSQYELGSASGTVYGANIQLGATGSLDFWTYDVASLGWGKYLSIAATGDVTMGYNLNIGGNISGATASPAYIDTGNNYSNGATDSSLKFRLFYGASGNRFGFTVGAASDVQYHTGTGGFHRFYNNSILSVSINPSGTASSSGTTGTLVVTGGIGASGSIYATSFFESSDARLKNVISRDGDVITFNWKSEPRGRIKTGYLAQEIAVKFPNCVTGSEDSTYSVSYTEVHTIKIRELEKKVSILEEEITQLKKTLLS